MKTLQPSTALNLSIRIFHPKFINRVDPNDYDLAFDLWHEVWRETRQEINVALPTYSDNFTRQDEILVLRHGERPIATCCYRYVNLRQRCTLLDSYFDPDIWPEPVRAMIPELGNVCALGSHIFVHHDFRGGKAGVSIRNVMCSLAIMRLQHTGLDLMLGMVRTDRGMDRVFQDNGSVTLARTRWHNWPIDLIALFPKTDPVVMDPRTAAAVQMAVDASSALWAHGGLGWAAKGSRRECE
jgi:hypothetical protein